MCHKKLICLNYKKFMQKVSVVIPTYNYAHFIGEAIESILAQTFPVWEILVVDDGSTDNTEQVVAAYGDKVRYLKQENSGVCAARNFGVENSSGDFIAFFDADDICFPTKIEKQMAKFAEDTKIGLVHCGMREFNPQGNTIRYHFEGRKEGWIADEMLLMMPVITASGSSIMVSRKAFNAVGGFDTDLTVGEDWDFCYRVARKFKVGFVPEILVDYRYHGKNTHLNLVKMERSMKIAFEKAFNTDNEEILRLRRKSYGGFYQILAGSYFTDGNYLRFAKYSLKSLLLMPENSFYFLTFPLRRFKRGRENTEVINEINFSNDVLKSSLPAVLDNSITQKISVVIPTYNYADFISEAVESVLAQTFPVFEIIVVDDGSNDNTEEIIKQFGDKVKYIKQRNGGVCAARNNGVENAGGDFIAFLDADDVWFPEKIEKQMAKFAEDTKIGLVHCRMREFDTESGETMRLHLEGEEGWVADGLLLLDKTIIIGCGGSIIVRRKAFETVGGFDTNLKVGEDWDFCYRIARKFKVGFVREILVDYRYHGKNSHLNVREMDRSMNIFYEKAFDTDYKSILRLRRKSYGNFYKILAGSYFTAGNYQRFMKYLLKSLWLMPENISHFLAFPLRRLKKSYENKSA